MNKIITLSIASVLSIGVVGYLSLNKPVTQKVASVAQEVQTEQPKIEVPETAPAQVPEASATPVAETTSTVDQNATPAEVTKPKIDIVTTELSVLESATMTEGCIKIASLAERTFMIDKTGSEWENYVRFNILGSSAHAGFYANPEGHKLCKYAMTLTELGY